MTSVAFRVPQYEKIPQKSKDFPRKMQYTECGTSKYEYICHVAYVKPRKTNANVNTHPPKKKRRPARNSGHTQVLSYFIV